MGRLGLGLGGVLIPEVSVKLPADQEIELS